LYFCSFLLTLSKNGFKIMAIHLQKARKGVKVTRVGSTSRKWSILQKNKANSRSGTPMAPETMDGVKSTREHFSKMGAK
jgi:hypothetical protein